MVLLLVAMCFAGVATAMTGMGAFFTHQSDREYALRFAADALRGDFERRFAGVQDSVFFWSAMEEALETGDHPFLEEQGGALARDYGVLQSVFFHHGKEVYRVGVLPAGQEPFHRGSPGQVEGFFLDEEPVVRMRLPVLDDDGYYRGYTALVTMDASPSLRPFSAFLGYTIRIVPVTQEDVPLVPGFALRAEGGVQSLSRRTVFLWLLGGDFFSGTLVLVLALQYLFRQRDLAAHLLSLSSVLATRDTYTADHSERVGRYALRIARRMGLGGRERAELYEAARLHDLGKVLVPDAILLKPGPLTPEEFSVIKEHPARGADMVYTILERRGLAAVIRGHHERWDGSGYPDGLMGEAIPRGARILAVADVVDAMSTARPYHPPRKAEEVRRFLLGHRGKLFDPAVVDAALESLPELHVSLEFRSARISSADDGPLAQPGPVPRNFR